MEMKILSSLVQRLRPIFGRAGSDGQLTMATKDLSGAVADYWTRHNVTLHRRFSTAEESLSYLAWRNDQYFGYSEKMPVTGQDDKVVLDYGCGPGHDLVGFGAYSRPARLIGCDVSSSSLNEARERLALHGFACDLVLLDSAVSRIPLDDASVDYISCSGVIHHCVDPVAVLAEFRRVLRPDGAMRVMVYNYDSLWLHYYVAFVKVVEEQKYAGVDIREAFSRTTDGEDCPIARVYRPAEFIELATRVGLKCEFSGAAVSAFEASIFNSRFRAIMDHRLRQESRRFLSELEMDKRGLPVFRNHYAGVDGCYLLRGG